MAGFAADFLGGLAGGVPQGIGLWGQLQGMAMRQKQFELEQQMEERRRQLMEQQLAATQANSMISAAKIKDPKVRQAVFGQLGLDPGLAEAIGGEDQQFNQAFSQWAQEMGTTPAGASVLGRLLQEDPGQAIQGVLSTYRARTGAETADERMALTRERLGLSQQQLELSGQRFNQLQMMQGLRAQGMIPPMGYQFQGAPGEAPMLAPIPGGPPTIPTGEERKAADFLGRARESAAAGLSFLERNPDYLSSWQADLDAALQSEGVAGQGPIASAGAALGGAAGAVAGIRSGHPYIGLLAGGAVGGSLGKAVDSTLQRWLTSDKGKEFQSAWAPFINATLRRDTGATINNQEWQYAFRQFIPMPGDPPEAMTQKEQNRNAVMQGMVTGAGRAAPQLRTLAPSAEQEASVLAQKYRAGQATPEEIQKLQGYLRAKGLSWQ